MEKLTFIYGEDIYLRHYKTILELPAERQRRLYYGKRLYDVRYITKKETDTHIYWSISEKKPKFYNNKLFFAHKNLQGVSHDKSKKTTKIWFGQKYAEMASEIKKDILVTFDMSWVLRTSHGIQSLISNTIFDKIIKGKISNSYELCQAYLKVAPYKNKQIDIELFTDVFSKLEMSPKSLSNHFIVAKDCNVLLKHIMQYTTNGYYYHSAMDNLVMNACILNEEVDFSISNEESYDINEKYIKVIAREDAIYEYFKENDYE
jgi:hypothetical protein